MPKWPNAAAFAPDGHTLASGHDDRKVRLWEVGSGGERLVIDHGDRPAMLAFSPDGALLASVCNETRSNATTAGFTPPPDGQGGPTADDQAKVRVWDVLTGSRLAALAGHPGAVVSLAFSPDGK